MFKFFIRSTPFKLKIPPCPPRPNKVQVQYTWKIVYNSNSYRDSLIVADRCTWQDYVSLYRGEDIVFSVRSLDVFSIERLEKINPS